MKKAKIAAITFFSLLIIASFPLHASNVLNQDYIHSVNAPSIISASSTPSQPLQLTLTPVVNKEAQTPTLNTSNIALTPGHKYINRSFKSDSIGNSLFTVTLLSQAALHAADYFSTVEALKYPGLQEGNPLMKPFVKNQATFAAVKIGITAFTYISMKGLYKKNKKAAWVMSLITNFALSYVVANNIGHINKAKASMR